MIWEEVVVERKFKMSGFTLGNSTTLATVTIRVKDRDKMIAFYRDLIGFALKQEENALAIMGTKENEKEQLWLEESPRATDHFGKIKRLGNYVIQLDSLVDIASVYDRLKKAPYQNLQVDISATQVKLSIIDPEENLVLLTSLNPEEKIKVEADLSALATEEHRYLAPTTRVASLALNTPDVNQMQAFFNQTLGFQKQETGVSLPNTLEIELNQSDSDKIATPSHEILGLDFVKFVLAKADLLALEQHLIEMKQAYFIDQKKTILTVYDPTGTEWWFMREKVK